MLLHDDYLGREPTMTVIVVSCIPPSKVYTVARTTMSNVLWVISMELVRGILERRNDFLTRTGKSR